MDEVRKSMNKTQIAALFGWCGVTLTKWMKTIPELIPLANKKGTGTYLYTEGEIRLIIDKYKESKENVSSEVNR